MRLAGSKANVAAVRIVFLFWLLSGPGGFAIAERLPIKTYATGDGLARDNILRIVQDSKGFIWFCTTEGLSRFDGYKFTNYGVEQGLAGRQVNDFLESRNGTYWAATDRGLCRFNNDQLTGTGAQPGSFVAYYPSEDASARAINVICEDRAGTIWCGTDAGLFRLAWNEGQPDFSLVDVIQPEEADVSGKRPEVRAILEDRRGSLWIVPQRGLRRLRPDGVVEKYGAKEGLPAELSAALLEDHDGHIWVGSALGAFVLVSDPRPSVPVVARRYTSKDGLPNNLVTCLCQFADGRLWIGVRGGVARMVPPLSVASAFRSYAGFNGLGDAEVTALSEDRDGNLWIGTAASGVMKLASNGFATYDRQDGLGGIRVSALIENRAGDLCAITTDGSINRFDRGRFTSIRLTLPRGMSYWGWGWYQTIFEDSAGEWWMNTGEGLVRYPHLTSLEEITRTRPRAIYTTRDGLPTNEVFRLFEDTRRDIWISTVGDVTRVLARWDRATGKFHRYSPADGIPDSAPTAFCEDASGNLWIGFYGGGLLRYREGRFASFRQPDGVPPGMIRALYRDHAGRLWIATGGGGVARLDNPGDEQPHFAAYSAARGLSSNQATCVTEDQWGMIYVGTGRGVDKIDPATGQIKHYTAADGLAGSFVNVAFRHNDGSLWFGTLQGLSRFMPQPETPTLPPATFITGLRIAGIPYPIPEPGAVNLTGPELRANQNNVEIEFSGLSFAAGESLRYQYKLDGASSEWSAASDQRVVTYPSLSPGSYHFLVRAVSSDGIVSRSAAEASFNILPPVWQRWWFRLLGMVLIAMPIGGFMFYRHHRTRAVREAEEALRRSREERLAELERVRSRIATDLHDDIGSSLSQIYLLSEVVRQRLGVQDERVVEPLAMIASASHEVVNSMSDIVWAINPQKDHLSDLIQRMRRFASDTFAAREIGFRFQAPAAERDVRLGANIRREAFLIFKESVHNVVKHSGCTEAEIEFTLSPHALSLRITDNGRGFETSRTGEGHGLASMRERARSIGGRLGLVSGPKGTTVILDLELGENT